MRSENEMVAYALETEVELLPHIPELLADLEELGSDAEQICDVLSQLDLPADATVTDLGSGKGAVAVEIAQELGHTVLGIELFQPFVAHSTAFALEHGVADRCRFIHGNVAELAGKTAPSDVAIYAALGDVLGRLDETIAIIRKYVKPGGYILVSDAFVRDGGSSAFAGFAQYTDHQATLQRLASCGDTLVVESLETEADESSEETEDEGALILGRARAIAQREPDLAERVMVFAESQAAEYEFIDHNLVGAIWVLKKNGEST